MNHKKKGEFIAQETIGSKSAGSVGDFIICGAEAWNMDVKCDFVTTTPTPGEASGLPGKTAGREFCGWNIAMVNVEKQNTFYLWHPQNKSSACKAATVWLH